MVSKAVMSSTFKYLTRDYYDGFINDRVKYGSGKI